LALAVLQRQDFAEITDDGMVWHRLSKRLVR
jgi:hypothetical protein